MLTKRVLGTGLCMAAFGYSAVSLYGDTVLPSVVSGPTGVAAQCADGSCVPRRLTNGYYPTKWRRWPVEPPAEPKPGVREGVSAPAVELPPPRTETFIPEGALSAPPPLEDGAGSGDFGPPGDSGPDRMSPSVPQPRDTMPRGEPQPDLPPELRRFNQRTPRPVPNIAGRSANRPAAVMEALRNEAIAQHGSSARGVEPRMPAELPKDRGWAEPLPQAPSAETPSIRPFAPPPKPSQAKIPVRDQLLATEPRRESDSRTQWTPVRETKRFEAQASAIQPAREANAPPRLLIPETTPPASAQNPETIRALAFREPARPPAETSVSDASNSTPAPPQALFRTASGGMNAPATIQARVTSEVKEASSTADFTIRAPASPAVLSFRGAENQSWSHGAAISNPLRGKPPATKVAFDGDEAAITPSPEAIARELGKSQAEANADIPANPLR